MTTAESMSATPAVSDLLADTPVIAVVDIVDVSVATELAIVLADAGITVLEVTLRSPVAMAALGLAAESGALCVGAGTVISTEQARAVVERGAQFLVSPGLSHDVQNEATELGVPYLPGVLTPTEMQGALDMNITEVKLFPVQHFGGLDLVNTCAAVFGGLTFIPSGGMTHDRAAGYLSHPQVAAVGGSWIAPPSDLQHRNWAAIARRAEAVVALSADLRSLTP